MQEPIGYLIKRAQAALRARMERAVEVHGLTTPQYAALSALEQEPGLSNAELARRCFVTPQTMIRVVDKLASRGLIERAGHETHGRVLVTTLTREGERAVASCHADVGRVEQQMLAGIARRDRERLRALLVRCIESLETR